MEAVTMRDQDAKDHGWEPELGRRPEPWFRARWQIRSGEHRGQRDRDGDPRGGSEIVEARRAQEGHVEKGVDEQGPDLESSDPRPQRQDRGTQAEQCRNDNGAQLLHLHLVPDQVMEAPEGYW